MERLPEINEAFAELSTDLAWANGSHVYDRVHRGRGGIKLGVREYDPSRDDPSEINRVNILQYLGDGTQRYVDKRMPEKTMMSSVVLHVDPKERRYPELLQPVGKLRVDLFKDVASALEESSMPMDRLNIYAIGDVKDVDFGDLDPEIIVGTEEAEEAAIALAQICTDGLSIVFSNFYDLEFKKLHRGQRFDQTVAVKCNHTIELELPADIGKVALPYTDVRVNTRKPKELAQHNAERSLKHAAIRRRTGAHGAHVVQAAYTGRHNRDADFAKADRDIANALRRVGEI